MKPSYNSYQSYGHQSQDYGYLIQQLQKEIAALQEELSEIKKWNSEVEEDWDNQDLMLRWGISKRTTANYREQGLGYYKRGGRIYYTYAAREAFKKKILCNLPKL